MNALTRNVAEDACAPTQDRAVQLTHVFLDQLEREALRTFDSCQARFFDPRSLAPGFPDTLSRLRSRCTPFA